MGQPAAPGERPLTLTDGLALAAVGDSTYLRVIAPLLGILLVLITAFSAPR